MLQTFTQKFCPRNVLTKTKNISLFLNSSENMLVWSSICSHTLFPNGHRIVCTNVAIESNVLFSLCTHSGFCVSILFYKFPISFLRGLNLIWTKLPTSWLQEMSGGGSVNVFSHKIAFPHTSTSCLSCPFVVVFDILYSY